MYIYIKKNLQTFPIKHLLQAQKAVSYHRPVSVVRPNAKTL